MRSVTSRATDDAPITLPEEFTIGETVIDTSITRPVLASADGLEVLDPLAATNPLENRGKLGLVTRRDHEPEMCAPIASSAV